MTNKTSTIKEKCRLKTLKKLDSLEVQTIYDRTNPIEPEQDNWVVPVDNTKQWLITISITMMVLMNFLDF